MKNIKKIIVIIVFIVVTLSTIFFIFTKKNNEVFVESKNKENSLLSVMLETEIGGTQYVESNLNSFDQEYYKFNAVLSKCVNGSKIKYSETTKMINVETSKTDKCYAYFDKNTFTKTFEYEGKYKTFIAPMDGEYKIELWGASGGDANGAKGGKGAYTKGNIELIKGEVLYIYVGQVGESSDNIAEEKVFKSTFNGGGQGFQNIWTFSASGGGATDIRLEIVSNGLWDDFNSLKSRIMVAAGGGGGEKFAKLSAGGYGGALEGGEGLISDAVIEDDNRILKNTTGGTQTSGGETNDRKTVFSNGKFGSGGFSTGTASGGGGGYYGGAGGIDQGYSPSAGAGGSSFISGYPGCDAIKEKSTKDAIVHTGESIHYSGKVFTDSVMIAGNATMPSIDGGTEEGHTGNGYAKITLVK